MANETTELEAARCVVDAARNWRDIIFGAALDVTKAKSDLDDAITAYDETVTTAAGMIPNPAVMRTSVPQTHPPYRGAKRWRDWCWEPPYLTHTLVETWRSGWSEAEVIDVRTMHPWMNVANLYWCPLSRPVLEPEAQTSVPPGK